MGLVASRGRLSDRVYLTTSKVKQIVAPADCRQPRWRHFGPYDWSDGRLPTKAMGLTGNTVDPHGRRCDRCSYGSLYAWRRRRGDEQQRTLGGWPSECACGPQRQQQTDDAQYSIPCTLAAGLSFRTTAHSSARTHTRTQERLLIRARARARCAHNTKRAPNPKAQERERRPKARMRCARSFGTHTHAHPSSRRTLDVCFLARSAAPSTCCTRTRQSAISPWLDSSEARRPKRTTLRVE